MWSGHSCPLTESSDEEEPSRGGDDESTYGLDKASRVLFALCESKNTKTG